RRPDHRIRVPRGRRDRSAGSDDSGAEGEDGVPQDAGRSGGLTPAEASLLRRVGGTVTTQGSPRTPVSDPRAPAHAGAAAPGRRWPSVRELKAICRKGDLDPFWISNIFWRPVSIYVTWLLIRFGVQS